MTTPLKQTFKLPLGYSVEFAWDGTAVRVEWTPCQPHIDSPRAQRKFMTAYQAKRNEFLQTVAAVIRGNIAVLDMGEAGVDAVAVIPPPTAH